jgi:hypothetical protein
VIREIDIWRVAVLMVNRYADEAKANSDRRAAELATDGDHAGAAIWRRVTVAIEQLTEALVQIGVTSKNAPRLRHGELKHQARRSRPQVQLGPEGPDVPI